MTIIISPAKKLTPTNNSLGVETTRSEFPEKVDELVDYAKSLSAKDLIDKMKISSSCTALSPALTRDVSFNKLVAIENCYYLQSSQLNDLKTH